MNVLVTGGSGFVGKRLQKIKPKWRYMSSEDMDLLNFRQCLRVLKKIKPDAVIHLAGRVGGIKDNVDHPAEFFYQNVMMNTNVVHACYKAGVKRLLASLSTCSFPDSDLYYPFTEENIFDGPPAVTNLPYGFSKRALYIQILSYRKQYKLNYSCFSPSNLYGPGDNFDSESSHFVPAMISKLHRAKDGDEVVFWGTGEPKRQQLYVDDLCEAIPLLLEKHEGMEAVIVAPEENLSIKEMVELALPIMDKDVNIKFNQDLDGQFRKDGDNSLFNSIIPGFKFTSFEEGLKKTYEWYKNKR